MESNVSLNNANDEFLSTKFMQCLNLLKKNRSFKRLELLDKIKDVIKCQDNLKATKILSKLHLFYFFLKIF